MGNEIPFTRNMNYLNKNPRSNGNNFNSLLEDKIPQQNQSYAFGSTNHFSQISTLRNDTSTTFIQERDMFDAKLQDMKQKLRTLDLSSTKRKPIDVYESMFSNRVCHDGNYANQT